MRALFIFFALDLLRAGTAIIIPPSIITFINRNHYVLNYRLFYFFLQALIENSCFNLKLSF